MSLDLATIPATTLDVPADVMASINREHELCQRAYLTALEHAINAGNLLRQVRQHTHGWRDYLETHFTGSDRTAQLYMQLADMHHQSPQAFLGTERMGLQAALRQAQNRISPPAERDPDDQAPDPEPAERGVERGVERWLLSLHDLADLADLEPDHIRGWLDQHNHKSVLEVDE